MSDATGLTEAGYVGEDVDLLLWRLLEKSGYNLGLAQRGIVFLDEVDKIAKSQPNPLIGGKDVGGQGVQQALLKMIEGTVIDVKDRRKGEHSAIPFDTSSLLFIFSGAFNGLEQLVKDRSARVPLGFVHHDEDEKAGRVISKGKIKRLKTESKTGDGEDWKEELVAPDLIQFGMIPEFIGRIPVVAALNELDQKSLERILVEPEDSLISQYQQLFALNSTKLVFTPEAISLIASLAIDMDVGARGLRSIMVLKNITWKIR